MNLIYDRTQTDINNALSIRSKYQALGDWSGITEEETAQLKRGTYTCFDDMNRVDAAVRDIGAKLTAAGYPVRYTSPVPPPEPEYTPLSYIESSGTQYIDTGYKPNSNTRVVLSGSGFSLSGNNQGLFGARAAFTEDTFCFLSTSSAYRSDYGTANDSVPQGTNLSSYFLLDKDKNVCKVNGTVVQSAVQTFTCSYNLYICAINTANTVDRIIDKVKIYYCQIYDNGVLVRDFVPAKKSGIVGLYDRIEKKMYANSGTGEFKYGEVVEYTELTYIQSSGTQYIDTGIKPTQNIVAECRLAYLGDIGKGITGARGESSTIRWGLRSDTTAKKFGAYIGTASILANAFDDVAHTFKWGAPYGLNVDGTTYSEAISETFNINANIVIFGYNNSGTVAINPARVEWYKIYDNDVLIRDYMPAIQNGRTGLYDKVENKMYYSNGTDDFIAGEVVTQPETPDEPDYTVIEKLSYAQTASSEPTMYHIDTGLSIKQGDTVNISLSYDILAVKYDDRECVLLSFPPAQSPLIIGRALIRNHGIRQKQIYLGGQISNYQTQVITYTWFGTYQNSVEEVYYSSNPEQFSNCTAQLIITSDKIYTLCAIGTNQLYKSEIPSIDFWSTTERKILLLQEDQNNINENASYYRFKKLEIEINGEKHKFVPCKNENNKVGFLDEFDNSIVYNELGGVLLPGEVTETVKIPKPIFYLGDIINYDIWRTYLDNAQAIRDAYYTMPDTPKLPEPTAPLNFDGANAIEKLLFDVQVLYNAMLASYRKCGTFQAGNNKQRLPLQRSVT